MINHSISPISLFASLWRYRGLISDLAKRDALGRYKGSALGVAWSLLTPLLMLGIYTFVFSEVFKARWGGGGNSKAEFAIVLFAGLIVFNIFAECIGRAPGLVIANTNFVKKLVFPLEILSCVSLASALYHAAISIAVLLCFQLFVTHTLPFTLFLLPLVLLPLILFTLGLSWFLSATGVYLRDIGQTIGIFITGLMFLSPVFFPISAIPEKWRFIVQLNPLGFPIEQARNVMIWGRQPDWIAWCVYTFASVLTACAGFAWFQKTRKGFADVL